MQINVVALGVGWAGESRISRRHLCSSVHLTQLLVATPENPKTGMSERCRYSLHGEAEVLSGEAGGLKLGCPFEKKCLF